MTSAFRFMPAPCASKPSECRAGPRHGQPTRSLPVHPEAVLHSTGMTTRSRGRPPSSRSSWSRPRATRRTSPSPSSSDSASATPEPHRHDRLARRRARRPRRARRALLAEMTIDEKIGQMTQLEQGSVDPDGVARPAARLGPERRRRRARRRTTLPAGTDGQRLPGRRARRRGSASRCSTASTPSTATTTSSAPRSSRTTSGSAPPRDPALVERIGGRRRSRWRRPASAGTSAPVVAVPQDVRWGRTYEGYGEDPLAGQRARRRVHPRAPGHDLTAPDAAAATAKHFVGDGGTACGSSTTPGYSLDQGVTDVDEATFRAIHLAPYEAAIEAGARIVMASFSSTTAGKVHGDRHLLTDVLKGELGFSGFVVSDWAGVDQVDPDYDAAVATGVSTPASTWSWSRTTGRASRTPSGPGSRRARSTRRAIDDAVARILRVKFEMGLFEHPMPPDGTAPQRRLGARPRARPRGGRQSRRCCSRPRGRAAASGRATTRPARRFRRRRHRPAVRRLDDHVAGLDRADITPGHDHRRRRSAPGSATGSVYTGVRAIPAGTPARRSASSSSPSRPTPRARATPRRSRSRQATSPRSTRSARWSTGWSWSSCPGGR